MPSTREVFRERRKFLHRSPEQVAAAAGISVAAYRDWEAGSINFDDVEVLAWIEAAIERDPARTAREKISVVSAAEDCVGVTESAVPKKFSLDERRGVRELENRIDHGRTSSLANLRTL